MAQGTLADADVKKILSCGPWLGIDSTTAAYFVDAVHATDSINMIPDRVFLGYVTVQGRALNTFAGTFASAFYGLAQFQRAGLADEYVAAVNSGGNGILQYAQVGGTPAALTLPATEGAWSDASFTTQQNWLFVCDGVAANAPLKIDTSFNVTNWGITPPGAAVSGSATGSGPLYGNYYYIITFFNAVQESSGGTVSAAISASGQNIALTGIPVSSDAQVTGRNIYRFGGTLQTISLVHTISDNTTTTYTDTLGDSSVTGQQLVLHRDPPQAFYDVVSFMGSIWGFGYAGTAVGEPASISGSSDLWFSNFEEPWGFDNVDNVIPVGRNSGGDSAVAVRPLGSILCLLKSQSLWAYWGASSPTTDPPPFPVAPVGCAAKRSAIVAYQKLWWISPEATAQSYDGQTVLNISDNRGQSANSSVKSILKSFSAADLAASVSFAHDYCIFFSFPTQNITLVYSIQDGQWYKLGWATDNAVFNLEEQNLVIASRPAVAGTLDQWFAAETDLGSPITSSYSSAVSGGNESPQATKIFRYAVLLAPVQSGATATVSVVADPFGKNYTTTRTVNLAVTPSNHQLSMPPNMMGPEAQIIVSVTSSQRTLLHRIDLFGWIKRQFVPQG